MRYLLLLFLLFTLTLNAQINDPIPGNVRPSGLLFELEEVATIQGTSAAAPKARINMLREVPDESGRLFVIDLRGFLWQIDEEGTQTQFLSIKNFTNRFIDMPGKGTGFGAFAFHPAYAQNGKFYTSHAERTGSGDPDFTPPTPYPISLQWVLTEWTMDNPADPSFSGTQREVLRIDFPNHIHGMQDIQFNPTVSEEDADYGNLYICIGDGASSQHSQGENIQNKGSHLGTIFRINPLGTNSANGQYGIPSDNPFVAETGALGEIYCYGFRNPHRITWDMGGDNKMLIGDIGEKNIEEINIGIKGANYGWPHREGTFLYDRAKGREHVFPLPANDSELGYTYPVAQYDHDEGLAIVGGYVYRGSLFPDLDGHYIFGDIVSGEVYHIPVDSLQQGKVALIEKVTFWDENRDRVTLFKLGGSNRADLRFGIDQSGAIYFLTKADGRIYRLKSEATTTSIYPISDSENLQIFPNPVDQALYIQAKSNQLTNIPYEIHDVQGRKITSGQVDFAQPIPLGHLLQGVYFLRLTINEKLVTHQFIKAN